MSPPSGSGAGPELLSRHLNLRPAENFQRPQNSGTLRHSPLDPSGRTGDPGQGNPFKAPMPPNHEGCGGGAGGGGRREPSRPADLNSAGPSQAQDLAFPSSPLSALGSPHQSPYAQMPGTPRPDYSQQGSEPFTQQSPPYVHPQTPGTPRAHSDPPFMVAAPALRLEQFSQQPPGPGQRPSTSSPGPPRPSALERFPRSPGGQRSAEASCSRTPRPDQYSQQSPALRGQKAPTDGFTPQRAGAASSPLASESFGSAQQQVRGTACCLVGFQPAPAHCLRPFSQLSPGQKHLLDSFPRKPVSQVQKHAGMLEASFSGLALQASPSPFEPGPALPGPSPADKPKPGDVAHVDMASLSGPVSMLPQQGDSEEKLRQVRTDLSRAPFLGFKLRTSELLISLVRVRHSSGYYYIFQRQRLRQLLLRQQQQKNVSRQEKVLQEGAPGPPQAWFPKETTSAAPAEPFGRPPPPYPGTVRAPEATALRCAGNFPAEVVRSSGEAPVPRQPSPREQGLLGQAQR